MKPLTLAVDVDEVCADLLGEWLRRYNADFSDNLTPDNIDRWNLAEVVDARCGVGIYEYLKAPDLYDHVLPISGARPAIYTMLAMGHRIVYATACPRGMAEYKREWLLRWGFLSDKNADRDFVALNDKSLVFADILFDDRWENVSTFKGQGVLVTRPWNALAPAWDRISSLSAAPQFLRDRSL